MGRLSFFMFVPVQITIAGPCFRCNFGAIGMENMEIVDFLDIFTPRYGGSMDIRQPYIRDGCKIRPFWSSSDQGVSGSTPADGATNLGAFQKESPFLYLSGGD